MQLTLRRRLGVGKRANLIDVGFGAAVRREKLDPGRGLCATVFVRQKRKFKNRSEAIPEQIEVRLKRGSKFEAITLPTDVVEVGRLAPTGVQLDYGTRSVTSGVVVAWERPDETDRAWGLLTVGHVFPALHSLSQQDRMVTVQAAAPFSGTMIAKSAVTSQIDSVVVEVSEDDLLASRLLTRRQINGELPARSLNQLASDQNRTGTTLRANVSLSFRVHAFLPTLRAPGLGALAHIVSALAPATGTFQRGTSGCCWTIGEQPACVQVAGRAPHFRQGFGQALSTIVGWAGAYFEARDLAEPGSFRAVAAF